MRGTRDKLNPWGSTRARVTRCQYVLEESDAFPLLSVKVAALPKEMRQVLESEPLTRGHLEQERAGQGATQMQTHQQWEC